MEGQLKIYYDEEGDFLEISTGDVSECYFDNLSNGVLEIVDRTIGEIKGVTVFNFR